MSTRLSPALLASLLAAGVSLAAQQAAPTFRSTTNLVRVDASVTDVNGNPITGLTAKDFTLLDRGMPQEIATFEEVRHEAPTGVPVGHQDVASNVADSKSEIMVLVLDDEHIRKEWTAHAREVVEDFVRELNDDTLVALTSTSGRYRVELTSDRQRIIDALEGFEGRGVKPAFIAPGAPGGPPKPSSPGGPHAAPPRPVNPMASAISGNGQKGRLEGPPWDGPTLFNALAEAAGILGSDQTRHKAIGWISTGEMYTVEGMREAINRMRETGVTTYAIDPVGTANANPEGAYKSSGCLAFVWQPCDPRTPWQAAADRARGSLTQTARGTGGIAIVNDDDLAGGVRHIVSNFGSFYTLGFYPKDTTTAGARPLTVSVAQPAMHVMARMSYSLTDATPASPAQALPALVSGLVAKSDLAMRMSAAVLPPAASRDEGRAVVTLEVTAPRSSLTGASGDLGDDLTYGVFAFDTKTGRIARSTTKKATLALSATSTGAGQDVAYAVETSLALPPGHYQLRASATSAKTGTSGSVYSLVDVPDFRHATLALGDIVIGDSTVPLAKTADAASALGEIAFAPTLARTFAIGAPLHVYGEYVASRGHEPLDVHVTLVDTKGVDVWSTSHPLAKTTAGHVDFRMPVPSVPPGSYALKIAIGDEAASVSKDVSVRIK